MFEESLVESTALLASRNRWPAIASFGVQALLTAALLAVPLLHPEILPLRAPSLSLLAPAPKPPAPPTPPPQRVHLEAAATDALTAPAAPQMLGPRLPNLRPQTDDAGPGPLATSNFSMVGTGPALPFSANPGGEGSGTRIVRATAPASGATPRISSGVSNGLLLAPIQPVYPIIAKTTGTQGIVVIQAIISKTGRIESVHVQSGPVLLQAAAMEAVRNARYRPYLLNGEPTEVETTISITFHLGS